MHRLTVTLNRIVCYSAEHRKFRMFIKAEPFTHPREEMSQTEVPALDAFRNARAPTRKRECSDAIRSKRHIWVCFAKVFLGFEDVIALWTEASAETTIRQNFQGRNFHSYLQIRRDEVAYVRTNLAGTFEDNETAGLCNTKVDGLARRWVGGVCRVRLI